MTQAEKDGLIWLNEFSYWCRRCPNCNRIILGKSANNSTRLNMSHAARYNFKCIKCANKGKKVSKETKLKMINSSKIRWNSLEERKKQSKAIIKRFSNLEERKKTSISIKKAMYRTDVRKRHLNALHHSKWIKVRTDKGQLEMIDCWNKMGFNFVPNYQIKTDDFLCYIDGYDEKRNVVLEYDSKYHKRNKMKDLIRQNNIINILKPNKFWRYDAVNKQCKNILEELSDE